ncbi:uncharacterized protein [Onthophagus taurus]|uniref:uncharacterized protein n=1 Tax=Onthophagus taurus TaxID=166361 RepID=UPI0039BDF096
MKKQAIFFLTLLGINHAFAGACSGQISGLNLQEDETTNDLQITWKAPSGESGCTYTISYTTSAPNFKSLSFETDDLSYTIESDKLVPCSITKIGVKTSGGSEVSQEKEMATITSTAPILLDMTTSCDSIEMTWEGQSYNENMCTHTHFQLFCLSDTHNFTVPQQVTDEENRIFNIKLNTVLRPDIYYTCNGYMFVTLGGFTPASEAVQFWSNLDTVRDLAVTENNNLIRATWEPPLNSEQCGVGYHVKYENEVLGVHEQETSDVFIDLDAEIVPCTKYNVSVTPISFTGTHGSFVSALYEATYDTQSVSGASTNDDGQSLTVSWSPINIGKCNVKFAVDHYVDGELKDHKETVENTVGLERIPCSENKIEIYVIIDGKEGNPVVLDVNLSSSDIQDIGKVENLAVSGDKITWSAPISAGRCGLSYEVTHISPTGSVVNTVSTTETSLNLIPCSQNTIIVKGISGPITGEEASLEFVADPVDLGAPETLKIIPDFTLASVTLQAEGKEINSCPITEAVISCQKDGDDSAFGTNIAVNDNDERTFDVDVVNLETDKIYDCKLRWANSAEWVYFRFRTIPIPTKKLQVVDLSKNGFNVVWEEGYGKEFVNSYQLVIKSNGRNYEVADFCDKVEPEEFSYTLKGGDESQVFVNGFPAFDYDISLTTNYNLGSLGVKDESDGLNTQTLSDVPGLPENLGIEFDYQPGAAYNVTGKITWSAPCDLHGSLKRFGVKVSATFDLGGNEHTLDYSLDVPASSPNDVFMYELKEINPFFSYVVSVNTIADFDGLTKDLVITPPDICSCATY